MSVISNYLKGLSICLKGLSQQDIAEVAEIVSFSIFCALGLI